MCSLAVQHGCGCAVSIFAPTQCMAGAVARGQTLLRSPVAFKPVDCTVPTFKLCLAFFSGGVLTFAVLLAWLLSLEP